MRCRCGVVVLVFASLFPLFAAGALAGAGPARLLKDINPTPSYYRGSFPYGFQRLGNIMIFLATTPETGFELWRTDGTEAGTSLIKDINPGPYSSAPGAFVELDGALYFPADDGVHGFELWRTDGTEAGTRMVKEIRPGAAGPFDVSEDFFGSISWYPQIAGRTLYFLADDGIHGAELWRTDGTEAGTFLLSDIVPGPVGAFGTFDFNFAPLTGTAVGDTFFFSANDGLHGWELWKSDGTSAGTVMVKDIYSGPNGSFPGGMLDFQGLLLFTASDAATGQELWRSDGTEAGTVLVKDLNPYSGNSFIYNLVEANGSAFFVTYYPYQTLYRTDGTADGTVPLRTFSGVSSIREFNHSLILVADDGTHGSELWISDGTAEGTALLKDIDPGAPGSSIYVFNQAGGKQFFSADDGVHGPELWVSDGTEAGTLLVKDITPGPSGTFPLELADLNGTLFFKVEETEGDGTSVDRLWKSDGTPDGTGRVESPSVYELAPIGLGGLLLFGADDGIHGYELWKTDGSDAGTALVKDINPSLLTNSSNAQFMGALPVPGGGQRMLFSADDGAHGNELWVSDGTGPGTRLLKDINPGAAGSWPSPGIVHDGAVYFAADDGEHGYELWKTDGTEAETVMVADIAPGLDSGLLSVGLFAELGASIFFGADDGVHGRTLWKSDGTPGGTVQVADVDLSFSFFNAGGNYRYAIAIGGTLYFGGRDPAHGLELWKTDGTREGTALVKDIAPGTDSSGPRAFAELDGKLFMAAYDRTHGYEPWLSDGTDAGTHLLKDINPGGFNWSLGGLLSPQPFGGAIYFPARVNGPGVKMELWKTDGTEAGTVRVKDVTPGQSNNSVDSLTVLGGKLYFGASSDVDPSLRDLWRSDGTEEGTTIVKSGLQFFDGLQAVGGGLLLPAYDDDHGLELWRSDGTEAGTVLAQDIAPGPDWSFPDSFTEFGDRIFLTADDGVAGPEPWVAHAAILFDRPAQALADLRGEVKALHLARGTETSLTAKLDAACGALASGQTTVAILALEDFIHHVDVLAPKKISEEAGSELREFAEEILDLLDAGPQPDGWRPVPGSAQSHTPMRAGHGDFTLRK